MSELTKTESTILTDAAKRGGSIEWPARMKPTGRERLIARFMRDGLIAAAAEGDSYNLTCAGYRAVGLEPPRVARTGTKRALMLELLARDRGASLAELIEATGWLPHTTRAALSRLRSGGKTLIRGERPEGGSAYRLEAVQAQ